MNLQDEWNGAQPIEIMEPMGSMMRQDGYSHESSDVACASIRYKSRIPFRCADIETGPHSLHLTFIMIRELNLNPADDHPFPV